MNKKYNENPVDSDFAPSVKGAGGYILPLILCLFIAFSITSCQKNEQKPELSSNVEKVQTEEITAEEEAKILAEYDRPDFDKNKDYTNDASGNWSWKVIKDGNMVGEGLFRMKEENGKIKGLNTIYVTNIKAIPGKGGNKDLAVMIMTREIKGKRSGDNLIQFELMNKEGKSNGVKNTAKLEQNGQILKGITSEESIVNGEKIKVEYQWTAERVTG